MDPGSSRGCIADPPAGKASRPTCALDARRPKVGEGCPETALDDLNRAVQIDEQPSLFQALSSTALDGDETPPPADDGSPVVVPPAKAANPPVLKASVSVGVGTDAKAEVSVGVAPRTADVAVTADVGTSSTPPPPDEPAASEGAEAAQAVEAPAAEAAEPAAAEAAEAPAAEDAAAAPDDPGEGQ